MISILCVDDEPAFLELTRAFLEQQSDILVDSAPSALEAIEMLKRHSYDAIVSDYMMSGMDGLKLLSHVRSRYGEVPFILFTGRGREEIVIQALNNGADFYLQKGGQAKAQFAELAHKIRQAVDRRKKNEALSLAEFSVEHAAISTFWIDQRGKVIKANREAAHKLGYSENEMLTMHIWDIYPHFSQERWKDYWEELESKHQLTLETSNRKKDGTTFSVEVNSNFLEVNGKKYNFAFARDISDSRRSEEVLRRSEERFRGLVEGANSIILKFDTSGRITFANSFAHKFFGYEEGELVGRPLVGTIFPRHDSKGEDLLAFSERVTCNPDEYPTYESENITKEGRRVFIAWTNRATRDKEGQVQDVLAIGNDVTERRNAEEKLIEDRERWLVTQSLARLGEMDYDISTGEILWSDQVFHIFGLEGQEALDFAHLQPYIHPDDREQWKDGLERAYDEGKPTQIDYRVVQPTGEVKRVTSLFRTVHDETGYPKRLIGTVQDLTESTIDSYRVLVQNIPGLIFRVHLRENHRIQFMNDMLFPLTGFKNEEAKRGEVSSIESLIKPDDRARVSATIRHAIETNHPFEIEFRMVRKDGAIIYVAEQGRPIMAADGAPLFIDGIIYDISNRKSVEEAVRRDEQRFCQLANMLPAVVFEVDSEGELTFISENAKALMGYGKDDLIKGLNFLAMVAPESRERVAKEMQEVGRGYLYREDVFNMVRKDGTIFPATIHCAPISQDDLSIGVRGLVVDVSTLYEFKQMQSATLRIVRATISHVTLEEFYKSIHEILMEFMPVENFYIALYDEAKDEINFPYFVDQRDPAPGARKFGRGLTENVLITGQPLHVSRDKLEELYDKAEVDRIGSPPVDWIGVPLRSGQRIVGIMASQSYDEKVRFTEKEMEFMQFVSSQVALAIERKRAEVELERSVSLLRTTFESTDDGILIVDENGQVLACNDRYAKMWCIPDVILCTKDDNRLLNFVLDQLMYPEEFLERVRVLYSNDTQTSFDTIAFKDGRFFERYSQPYYEEGKVAGRIWSFCDISERKKAEDALNKSERELKSIINSAKDAIYVKDNEGVFIMANEAMGRTFNRPLAELVGITDLDLFGAEMAEANARTDRQVLAGRVMEEEITWSIGGAPHAFSLIKVPLKDEKGEVIGICGIARDTSERKKVEAALQEANNSLNLLNSITRHDVLNQLMIIRGYSDLVRAGIKDQKLLDYMDKVERATRNIRQQILFTRDFQKLGVAEPVWHPIEELLDKALTNLEVGRIDVSVDLGGLEVFGDPMLEKVFYNLVDNTLRHGEKATRISVSCQRSGPNLLLVYEDDGTGIKEEEKERIFDRGFGKNTGLGLFLTKAILKVTKIDIKENGEYGKGARFEMLIPDGMYRFREWDDSEQ